MMVEFGVVRWKNFLSTGNSFNEIFLNADKTTLLVGLSGSGKSTLLDAIAFALFDKPFRAINKDQIVNTINEKGCLVELEFRIGKKQYLIRRGRKPVVFEIFVDGVLLNQDAANKDYQKYLEKHILKFNFKSFTQIVVLGASNFTPFMQLKAQDRRQIIENLLDIEVFSIMNELLKSCISDLKESTKQNLQEVETTQGKIKIHEQFILDLEKDNQNKILENQKRIDDNNVSITKLQDQITLLQQAIQANEEILNTEPEVNNQVKEVLDYENKIEATLKVLQKDVDFYSEHDNCPKCKQTIEADFKNLEIQNKTTKIAECQSALKTLEDKIQKLSLKQQAIKKVKDKVENIKAEIRKHESSIHAFEEYNKKVYREISDLQKPRNNIEDERKIIKELGDHVKTLELEQSEFALERSLNELATNLLKDSGVKSQIIKQYLPVINNKINYHLQEMNFFVTFTIDENFNESIKSRGRDDLSYANFSEGEKQRIDLALLFTWRAIAKAKNSINTNLLILDEVFDSYLDNSATENVLLLLNSKMFKDTNIFVISHKETISDKFDKTIKFTKKQNFSIIEP
jgi:DNA repair exonuclease SbcCD ATPase subunit